MKLISLTLRNFKGVRDFTLTAGGQSVSLAGRNESGKTSIADAFTWLLFGKDMQDRTEAKFGIKTRDSLGQQWHNLQHEVEGVFEHAGRTFTLRRMYAEDWTRKRGAETPELTGHTTSYFIDDAPVKKAEYDEFVSSIVDEKRFKMLTVPHYFAETLDWKERRAIVAEIAGDVSDEAILVANPHLSEYPRVRGNVTHDMAKDRVRANITIARKALEEIPARIDEAQRSIVPVQDADLLPVQKQAAVDAIARAQEKAMSLVKNPAETPHDEALAALRAEQQAASAEYDTLLDKLRNERNARIQELDNAKFDASTRYGQAVTAIAELNQSYAGASFRLQSESARLQEMQGKPPAAGTCNACGQPLPESQQDAARHAHAEQVKAQIEKVATAKSALEALDFDKRIKALEKQREAAQASRLEYESAIQEIQRQDLTLSEPVAALRASINARYARIAERNALRDAYLAQNDTSAEQIAALKREQDELAVVLADVNKRINTVENNARAEQRIAELGALRQLQSRQLVDLEKDLSTLEEFERVKSGMITKAVNGHFKTVEFILFREQINGGLAPCCDVVYKGVPYSEGLNTAGRIQAGIAIINVLAEHFGVSAPIIVDNRESVTTLPDTDAQVISLVVSSAHPTLTLL